MATLKERIDQHDREIAAIRRLVLTGMKLLVRLQEDQKSSRKEMRELRAEHRHTEKLLQSFINSLKRGGNGHTNGRTRGES